MRLLSLSDRLRRKGARHAKARPALTFRPRLDALEERRLLAVLWVDNNPANAPVHPTDFTTIAAAVAAANPNDTIKVSPGTAPYVESVLIDKSLTIIGGQVRLAGEHGATIVEVPDSSAGFDVEANSVTINRFTIRPAAGATTDVHGIDTGSIWSGAQILNNIFAGDTLGIYLNSNGLRKTLVQGNTFASNNLVGTHSGTGIYSDEGLKNAVITDNFFSGDVTAAISLLGGDGSFGSLGTHSKVTIQKNTLNNDAPIVAINMSNSTITGNKIFNPAGDGILFAGAVTSTTVCNNQLTGTITSLTGIQLQTNDVDFPNVAHDPADNPIPNSGDSLQGNKIYGFGENGIWLQGLSHNINIDGNTANNNGFALVDGSGDGLQLEDTYSNTVKNNTFNSNARDGIRLDNAQANRFDKNTVMFNGEAGMWLVDSNNNTINNVTANKNGNFVTGVGDGFHIENSNGNTLTNNTAKNNAHDGIHVLGTSAGNIVKKNTSKFNGFFDLEDETVGGGTAGTANFWQQNAANSRSPLGLG